MTEVSSVATCDAPVEVAFAYLDDHRNVTTWWHDMQSYTPVGEPDHGLGAVFEAVSKVGPSTLKSTVKAVEWEPNTRVHYTSIAGMDTATTFEFAPVDETHSTVRFSITFQLPGGIAGKAMEKALEPLVRSAVNATAQNISTKVGEHYAAQLADRPR